MNPYCNTTLVEEILYDRCESAGTTDNIYAGRRPEGTTESMESFVVVRMTGSIKDYGIYSKTVGTIYLYARNLAGGIKNNQVLLDMHKTLESSFPYIRSHYSVDTDPDGQETGFPDANGYYIVAINLSITIS